MTPPQESRPLTLMGATGVGVGAIVGGGVLALAGVAFATSGPSAILAFALNGVVALLTVLSFSELASRFPESGGTYTYARKVLSVDAAFGIGWVVWFASVVAAVLYALGFAVFFHPFLEGILALVGVEAPAWLGGRFALLIYALGAVGYYSWALLGSADGGGQWPTVGKVALFLFVIGGGVLAPVVGGGGSMPSRRSSLRTASISRRHLTRPSKPTTTSYMCSAFLSSRSRALMRSGSSWMCSRRADGLAPSEEPDRLPRHSWL